MGDHVEHALLDLGIARDLGELPILSGHLAEEIFLISHRGLPRYPQPTPADVPGAIQNISGLPQGRVCLDLAGLSARDAEGSKCAQGSWESPSSSPLA